MKHLPIVGSSAPTTEFCSARIDGPGNMHLWIDGNSKITRDNGTYAEPRPNAFSLVQVKDCPGHTPTCSASCYVHELERHAPQVHDLYKHNSGEIRWMLRHEWRIRHAWAETVGAWIAANAAGGFRWHVSGDVFSAAYAAWIRHVCDESREVPHWIYTRSFEFVSELMPARNLTMNLSCDKDNYEAARDVQYRVRYHHRQGRRLTLCYLVEASRPFVPDDLPEGSVNLPRLRPASPRLRRSSRTPVVEVAHAGATQDGLSSRRIRQERCHALRPVQEVPVIGKLLSIVSGRLTEWLLDACPPLEPAHSPAAPALEWSAPERGWMGTFGGLKFHPLAPVATEVDVADIAHGLAMTCRYGGQCMRYYSVAEHCVHVELCR